MVKVRKIHSKTNVTNNKLNVKHPTPHYLKLTLKFNSLCTSLEKQYYTKSNN